MESPTLIPLGKPLLHYFSPLGKLADRLYILPSVISSFLTWDKLAYRISGSTGPILTIFSPNERFCMNFLDPDLFFDSFRDVAIATDFWQNLQMTFIQHAGISQRIRISQFRLWGDKGHNFFYILCNFGDDRSTNRKVLAGSLCNFWDETAKMDISYQISQQVLDQTSPTFQLW